MEINTQGEVSNVLSKKRKEEGKKEKNKQFGRKQGIFANNIV